MLLRPARAEDVDVVWSWQRLPEVTAWMTRLAEDRSAFVDHFIEHLDQILLVEKDGRVIGSTKIAVQNCWAQDEVADQALNTEAEIGWALDPAVQGIGLGTEVAAELLAICFGDLGLHRVIAVCFAANTASWRIMEKIGMRREAHFQADSLHRDGGWQDSFSYAMLAEEWH